MIGIKKIRLLRGISLAELAQKTKYDIKIISDIEKGVLTPNKNQLSRIAKALCVPANCLRLYDKKSKDKTVADLLSSLKKLLVVTVKAQKEIGNEKIER